MNIKRFIIIMMVLAFTANIMWSKDDEVIVTRQLTTGQRNALPEKTIDLEMKRLTPSKKADPSFINAITQVMDTIANEDYRNRTFVLLLEPKANGEISIAVRNDDIITRGRQDASIYYGTLEHKRFHFVVLTGKDNMELLEQTFKRQGKVRFVLEFEFVDFPVPPYPTFATGQWSPDKGFRLLSATINDDPNDDRKSFDQPARTLD